MANGRPQHGRTTAKLDCGPAPAPIAIASRGGSGRPLRQHRTWFAALLSSLLLPLTAASLVGVERSEPAPAASGSVRGRSVAQAPASKKGAKAAAAEAATTITPEREAAVLKFVEQHHPELAALLSSLKAGNAKEYQRALRDLFRVSERLAQFYGRDPQRYDLELRLWQAQSRMDLLAARLQMSGNAELRTQLEQSLAEQFSLRQSLLRLERERAAERLKKLDQQLEALDASRDELLDRQLRQLVDKPVPDKIKPSGPAKAKGTKK